MVVIDYINDLDIGACRRINALSRRRGVKALFTAVSRLGDYPAWFGFGLVCAVQQSDRLGVFVVHTLATAVVGIVIYMFLKRRFVRERPYIMHGEIVCGTAPLDRYSFPSGHTLHAASFAVLYGSYEPSMLIVLVPFALLVAASRVILGLHYPSDVVVGAGLGAAIATAGIAVVA
ncbi:MAG: phosphatase PAP2 family protein [Pseudomonadota bacterium]